MCTDGTKHIYDAMGHIFSEVKYNSYSKSYIFNASKGKQQKTHIKYRKLKALCFSRKLLDMQSDRNSEKNGNFPYISKHTKRNKNIDL